MFGQPVLEGQVVATPTPTSVVTLPWPTLPVGWFSEQHTVSVATGGASAPAVPTGSPATVEESRDEGIQISGAGSQETGQGGDGGGGTVLDTNDGTQNGAGSSFGLMVVLLVGVLWF